MDHKMKNLLEKLNIEITDELINSEFKELRINNLNKSWFFSLFFERVLSCEKLKEIINGLNTFKDEDVLDIEFSFEYKDKSLTAMKTKEYWECMIFFATTKKGRVTSLKNVITEYEPNKVVFKVASDLEKDTIEPLIGIVISKLMKVGIEVSYQILIDNSLDNVEDKIKQSKDMFVDTVEEESPEDLERKQKELEEEKERKKYYRDAKKANKLNGEKVSPISEVPNNESELTEYFQKKETLDFTLEGQIFELEIKELKSGYTLLEAKLTDFEDSIVFKRFLADYKAREYYEDLCKVGNFIKLSGKAEYNAFSREVSILADKIQKIKPKKLEKEIREEKATLPRVELHLHTKMSTQDAITSIEDYVDRAVSWKHKAIALTDHDGVYAFPDFSKAVIGKDIKPIYGVESSFLDEKSFRIALSDKDIDLMTATFVVFDFETTGFSTEFDDLIEIGAVKIANGTIAGEYTSLINPGRDITDFISDLTSIRNDELKKAPSLNEVLSKFYEFSKDSILVAHNATFDIGHLYANYKKCGIEVNELPAIDTLQIARVLYSDKIQRFNLKAVSKLFKVDLTNHHRGLDDARATAEVFLHMLNDFREKDIRNYNQINNLVDPDQAYKYSFPSHITILVKNQKGLKNLYKIISDAHTNHFFREARVLKSVLDKYRDGLIIGSSCYKGELFETAMNKPYEELLDKMKYYDFIEVQPPSVYKHLIESRNEPRMKFYITETIKKLVKAGKELNKLVVATGDVHHLDPEDITYRKIYTISPSLGGGVHPLANVKELPSQHLMTTGEMLEEFIFLGDDIAMEIVVENTNFIADMIEDVQVFPKKLFTPNDDFLSKMGIPSMKEAMREMCFKNAKSLYGNPLPKYVDDRLNKEVNSIIGNGFSSVYYISHMLVKKSIDAGYVVGSRGSVGSSFAATMMGITEVNPLAPHYLCKKCNYSVFKHNEDEMERYPYKDVDMKFIEDLKEAESGYDLPKAVCPVCGEVMHKDGHDIPFETFMGFEGNKVPDIDLNFSGEYQAIAHNFTREVFGEEHTFRAGTISTVAEKTAFGYVRGYFESLGKVPRNAEVARIAKKIEGVKRTTGQHPGGIIVVPDYMDIYDITPVQYPSDAVDSSWRTSHFDYHKFEDNLLKLDILGHDDPTVLRHLMDYVEANPEEFEFSKPADIPVDDPQVYELFLGTDIINVHPSDLKSDVASYGIPEFGTNFVRSMLVATKPNTFAQLVKISGLSHGTDVWLNNAEDLVMDKHPTFRKVEFDEIIGCRDDIMVYLTSMGMEPSLAFTIMESVRKGKGLKHEWEVAMKKVDVPDWYIWSCNQIKYMFPKAHATAYVLMAMRIAWFKVHKPMYYYAAYFSKRASYFDAHAMINGKQAIRMKMDEIDKMGFEATATDRSLYTVLEVALELYLRGYRFSPIDINVSQATDFIIDPKDENALILPFVALDGLGTSVATSIVEAREEKPFMSKDDIKDRTRLNSTSFEQLDLMGAFDEFPDTSQISFDFGL